MIPKIEQNAIVPATVNVPLSEPSISFKTVAKDFQKALKDLHHLEKSCVLNQEMEALKAKMKKLEQENGTLKVDLESMQALKNENLKLKADLVAKEENRLLYNNAFDQKVKEVAELNDENEALKAKIVSFEGSSKPLIEEIEQADRPIQELTSSSIQSAIPVNDTGSDEEIAQGIPEAPQLLAICDRYDNTYPTRANVAPLKRSLPSTSAPSTSASKKAKIVATTTDTLQPWKCFVCKSRYDTIEHLRSHIGIDHPSRKHFCARCPYATEKSWHVRQHEEQHRIQDLKCSDSEKAHKCELCNISFFHPFALTAHFNKNH